MPVYKCKVKGSDSVRLVRASTAAQARDHFVSAETVTAEEMDDLMSADPALKVEKAGETPPDPADPANYAPGGPLHGKTQPAADILAGDKASTEGDGKPKGDKPGKED